MKAPPRINSCQERGSAQVSLILPWLIIDASEHSARVHVFNHITPIWSPPFSLYLRLQARAETLPLLRRPIGWNGCFLIFASNRRFNLTNSTQRWLQLRTAVFPPPESCFMSVIRVCGFVIALSLQFHFAGHTCDAVIKSQLPIFCVKPRIEEGQIRGSNKVRWKVTLVNKYHFCLTSK